MDCGGEESILLRDRETARLREAERLGGMGTDSLVSYPGRQRCPSGAAGGCWVVVSFGVELRAVWHQVKPERSTIRGRDFWSRGQASAERVGLWR